ncbi:MAG TPA: cytochrome P450 [Acidimicrobiales bacterium]|nr:cytochrome P450 [Acidimicrobiales bacterium]
MQQKADLTQAYDPDGWGDPAIAADPQSYYRKARAVGPVVPGTWGPQVVRRSTAEFVLQHPDLFSSGMEAVDLGQSVPLIPLQVDPPVHRNYRRLLDPIFAPRRMNVLEPDISKMVNERIDSFAERGECEFGAEFAIPLPSSVFLRLVGLPLSQLDMFLEMKDGVLRPSGADLEEIKVTQKAAAERVEAYFRDALEEHRRRPEAYDDLLSMFLTAEVDGQRLTEDEMVGICFLFLIAGLDTVTDSLECMFAYLAQHPDQRRRIVEDPSIIPSAVEELLRWETPVTTVPRIATQDTEVDGCPIRKGENVAVILGSANTDEEELADAYTVDLTRNPNKHFAFGGGVHRCLGSHLARTELRIALREWHRRIPDYSIKEGTTLRYMFGLRQLDELPLVFPPAAATG